MTALEIRFQKPLRTLGRCFRKELAEQFKALQAPFTVTGMSYL